MRRIPERRHTDSPALERSDRRRPVVEILALGVNHPAESARVIDPTHRVAVIPKAARLSHLIFQHRLLHRLDKPLGVFERPQRRRNRRHNMLAVLEHFDAMPRMARRIGRNEHRIDTLILNHNL